MPKIGLHYEKTTNCPADLEEVVQKLLVLAQNTLTDDYIQDVWQVLKTFLLPILTDFQDAFNQIISLGLEVFRLEFKEESRLLDNGFIDSSVDSFLENGFPLAIYLLDLLLAESKRCQHVLLFLNELLNLGFFFLLPEEDQLDINVEAIALAGLIGFVVIFSLNFPCTLLDVGSYFLGDIVEFFLGDAIANNSGPNLVNFSCEAALETHNVCLIDLRKEYLFFSLVGPEVAV